MSPPYLYHFTRRWNTVLCFLCTVLCLSAGHKLEARPSEDSLRVWINASYLSCLENGRSACECQKTTEYLLVYADTSLNQLIILPSVYFSWEDLEYALHRDSGSSNHYSIPIDYGIDSHASLYFDKAGLTLSSKTQRMYFTAWTQKRDSLGIRIQMRQILNTLPARVLLQYGVKIHSDSLHFSPEQFARLLREQRVQIFCPDDDHGTEMRILFQDGKSESFLMKYDSRRILLYRFRSRNRRQFIDTGKLQPVIELNRPAR